jgi:hypothetical protein
MTANIRKGSSHGRKLGLGVAVVTVVCLSGVDPFSIGFHSSASGTQPTTDRPTDRGHDARARPGWTAATNRSRGLSFSTR